MGRCNRSRPGVRPGRAALAQKFHESVAASLHARHALAILLVVAVWHVYDSVFSPGVFPLNTSIFTGRMTRRRMQALHPRELQRLEGGEEEAPGTAQGPGR